METTVNEAKKRYVYRDENNHFVSLAKAKERHWAHQEDGGPTKIYLHFRARVDAIKKGEEPPKRFKTPPPVQFHAGIQSPFDLRRRSGYAVLWQILAEKANQPVSVAEINVEANKRLQTAYPEWYATHCVGGYPTLDNLIVINRAPYNKPIEALKQRVILSDDKSTATLLTNVENPREYKKRGRKPGIKVEATVTQPEITPVAPVVSEPVVVNEAKPVETVVS